MEGKPGDGQDIKPAAPGAGAGTPTSSGVEDPTKKTTLAETKPGNGAPPREAGSQNVQHDQKIKIGDNEFTAADIQGILSKAAGFEKESKEIKEKLEKLEAKDLSDKEKAEKDAAKLREENKTLREQNLNSKIQTKLDEKGVQLKAIAWNHGVTEETGIDDAVQKLINENPGIIKAPGQPKPGTNFGPPGSSASPPGEPPAGTDQEKELEQKYKAAKTAEELAKLDREYFDLRGVKPPEGRQAI